MNTRTGQDIHEAAALLQQGEAVAIPTETVYGLAANALNTAAVQRIYAAKQRPATNPLIVHIGDVNMLHRICKDVPALALQLAQRFWPGPLTFILPKHTIVSDQVTAGKSTVGVRMPQHPLTLSLLQQLDFPLAAPSANLYGRISPTRAQHVLSQLEGRIPYILDGGPCTAGIESTIVGFEAEKIIVYRVGAVSLEALQQTGAAVILQNIHSGTGSQMAAGMSLSHYAPKATLQLSADEELDAGLLDGSDVALLRFEQVHPGFQQAQQWVLSPQGTMEEAARNLYHYLHEADKPGISLIIAQRFPDSGLGLSINDRLQRAAVR